MDFSRRGFLLRAGLVSSGIVLGGCLQKLKPNTAYKHITGSLKGPDANAGHKLRDKKKANFPQPTTTRTVDTLIIGSGISGLSAARWLKKAGHTNFEVLELENHAGGNAHGVTTNNSAHPFGAHYITIANNDDVELLDFLRETGVITHFENGLPFYNEYYLCFDPDERLLINGQWQEGLVPKFGIGNEDDRQIKRFFALAETLKKETGNDGKPFFNIPLANTSADNKYRKLDNISFKQYLDQEGFSSPYLLWYLNYSCKDDYGRKLADVSAWAGLSYFASHKGKAANAEDGAVLTWPEGNAFLVNKLKEQLRSHLNTAVMAYQVRQQPDGTVHVDTYHLASQKSHSIIAKKVILATPQFINRQLLADNIRSVDYRQFEYGPWVTANITVDDFPDNHKHRLSWDNVAYGTKSVGYVNASQQRLDNPQQKIVTFYLPLCDGDPRVARLAAYSRNYAQWLDIIIPEMEYMHPGITAQIKNVDIWLWGHGMITPSVNYIWGENRQQAMKPVNGQLFFAHTDLSGISIFEEGFHQGITAAKALLKSKI